MHTHTHTPPPVPTTIWPYATTPPARAALNSCLLNPSGPGPNPSALHTRPRPRQDLLEGPWAVGAFKCPFCVALVAHLLLVFPLHPIPVNGRDGKVVV